ncbi:SMP-30/gluconolactonase/LRE family protein [Actinoplanes sp. NPDC051633]|uniref:SMP-30/gluconolactonase/LRE family protein n=1 Tax=Actinoplanes sp. NPDC051633 TaxID=3155670 RepID=UPI00342B3782
MTREIREVLTGFHYLEAPRFHDGRLWVSDFYLHQVVSAEPDGSDVRVEAEVPAQPSGLGWLPDGRLLVVSMRDQRVLRREPDGTLVTHADLSGALPGHVNDMVVDERGRAYVGSFGFDLMNGGALAPSKLARVDPDGTVTVVAEELWFPNGSVLDGATLIVNETFGNRMTAFDVAEDGSLTNRRVWASFGLVPTETEIGRVLPQLVVAPDGACLDAEGAVWIADGTGGRALRVRQGGAIVDEVQAGSGVFAVGMAGHTLYLCAAPDFDEHARSNAREARLLAVEVDVPAAG